MLDINPKMINIEGAEMVLLTRAEFDAMVEALNEAEEDAADAEIYRVRKADLDAGFDVILPVEVSARCRKGESLLRAVRNWRGMTQAEVAEKTGFTQGYLSDLESGKREGTAQTLRMIAKALEIDPVMLVDPRE
jgi:DNA-binding XRE family transcriptional regulator